MTPSQAYRAALEAAANVAIDHKGSARRKRVGKIVQANYLPHEALMEVLAEERGEDIAADKIAAAIRALPVPQDAGDMVMVPREATEKMLRAGGDALLDAAIGHVSGDLAGVNTPFKRFWRAMINANE